MPRLVAWQVLRGGSPTPLRQVDAAAEREGLDARDRGLARRLVGTEIRRRGTLRAVLRHFAHGKLTPDLAAHLSIALVQALFLDRVPPHALVSEALDGVNRTLGRSKVPVANGILRNVLRALKDGTVGDPRRDVVGRDLHFGPEVFRDPAQHPLLWAEDALSMPAALMKRWEARHGAETARNLALAALVEPPLSVRAIGGGCEQLAGELAELGLHARPGAHPAILLLPAGEAEGLVASKAFAEGRATVQGETALRAAEAVGAAQGERVLDLCAAPGGKTAVLAACGAELTACDLSREKLARIESTLARLRPRGRVRLLPSDAAQGLEGELFDAVLVDAPCSNTGVLRRRLEARWRVAPEKLTRLSRLQLELLNQSVSHLRPAGSLVYSTCSLEPEENAQVVRQFLQEHPQFTLVRERELLPFGDAVDGAYVALLTCP